MKRIWKISIFFFILEIIFLIINIITSFSSIWFELVMIIVVLIHLELLFVLSKSFQNYIKWKGFWRHSDYDKIKQQIKLKILSESQQKELLIREIENTDGINERFRSPNFSFETLISKLIRIKKGEIFANIRKYYEPVKSKRKRKRVSTIIIILGYIITFGGFIGLFTSDSEWNETSPGMNLISPLVIFLLIFGVLVVWETITIGKVVLFFIGMIFSIYIFIVTFLLIYVFREFHFYEILLVLGTYIFMMGNILPKYISGPLKGNLFYNIYAFRLIKENNWETTQKLLIKYFEKSVDAFNDILKKYFKMKITYHKKILFNFIINTDNFVNLFENEEFDKFFRDKRNFQTQKEGIFNASDLNSIKLIKNGIESNLKEYDIIDYKWYKDWTILTYFGSPLAALILIVVDFLFKLPIW